MKLARLLCIVGAGTMGILSGVLFVTAFLDAKSAHLVAQRQGLEFGISYFNLLVESAGTTCGLLAIPLGLAAIVLLCIWIYQPLRPATPPLPPAGE
jgi:hypothetical protein